jgi:nitrogen fixation protein
MITGKIPAFAVASAPSSAVTPHPAVQEPAPPQGPPRSGGSDDLLMEMVTLVALGVLVGGILLLRRWWRLRSRKPLPGLPRERVLPLSRHDTLHDPKYLGRILQGDDPPPDA